MRIRHPYPRPPRPPTPRILPGGGGQGNNIYIYIYIRILHIYIYIYIHTISLSLSLSLSLYIYIYIYIHMYNGPSDDGEKMQFSPGERPPPKNISGWDRILRRPLDHAAIMLIAISVNTFTNSIFRTHIVLFLFVFFLIYFSFLYLFIYKQHILYLLTLNIPYLKHIFRTHVNNTHLSIT